MESSRSLSLLSVTRKETKWGSGRMEGKGEETAVRLERKKKKIIEVKHLHIYPITQNAHHLHRNNTNMERFKRERDDK